MTKEEFSQKFKEGFGKVVSGSKKAFGKAGNAVQDFSDKSVIKIEKKQFESKRDEQFKKLGNLVNQKFSVNNEEAVNKNDEEIQAILTEIEKFSEEIKKREDLLSVEN